MKRESSHLYRATLLTSVAMGIAIVVTPLCAMLERHAGFLARADLVVLLAVALGVVIGLVVGLWRARPSETGERASRALLTLWTVIFTMFFVARGLVVKAHAEWRDALAVFLGFVLAAAIMRRTDRFARLASLLAWASFAFFVADVARLVKLGIWSTPFPIEASAGIRGPSQSSDDDHPDVLHVMLDKFSYRHLADKAGMEPEWQAFAARNSLTFYPHHYATAGATERSVPDFMRVDTGLPAVDMFARGDRNTLFQRFAEQGYEVRVYGHYLPYCYRLRSSLAHCQQGSREEGSVANDLIKATELYTLSLSRSLGLAVFGQGLASFVDRMPVSSVGAVADAISDLETRHTRRPMYLYVHLVVPHDPFLLDSECASRPEWKVSADEARKMWSEKTWLQGESMRRYAEQSRCALKLSGRLIDAMARERAGIRSRILIHSDHGMFEPAIGKELDLARVDPVYLEEIFHVPAWTRESRGRSPMPIEGLTSNSGIASFLMGESATVPRVRSVSGVLSEMDEVVRYSLQNGTWVTQD